MSDKKVDQNDLVIKFANAKAAEHFATWLCEQGEQDYWNWMECREQEEDGDITVTRFCYHGEEDKSKAVNDPARYKEFMCDNTIRTVVSRLDK